MTTASIPTLFTAVLALHELVSVYRAHATFEEHAFLPLSEEILGRNPNHLAALGLSLHIRQLKPVAGYI
jgi:hypothetical protein